MKCQNCGMELASDARFCSKCGTPVGGTAVWRKKEMVLREKAEDSSDPEIAYEASLCKESSPKYYHSYGWEYYSHGENNRACVYNGRLYCFKQDRDGKWYVCSGNNYGGDIRIVTEVTDDSKVLFGKQDIYAGLCVNETGIYVFALNGDGDYNSNLLVRHYGFDGGLAAVFEEKYNADLGHRIDCVYIWDNKVYYVHTQRKTELKCADIDTGKSTVLYDKATDIFRVFVTEGKIIFNASYEKYDRSGQSVLEMTDWMLLDPAERTIESLSNPYCNPENVLDAPDVYDEESVSYNVNCDYDRKIRFFDFKRGIFWVERKKTDPNFKYDPASLAHEMRANNQDSGYKPWRQEGAETIYYEPRDLWGDREAVVPNTRVWRLPSGWISGKKYFDSEHFYFAPSYHTFESLTDQGDKIDWSVGNGGHGCCEYFSVWGNYLVVDIDASYVEKAYPLDSIKMAPLENYWFDIKKPLEQEIVGQWREGQLPEEEQLLEDGWLPEDEWLWEDDLLPKEEAAAGGKGAAARGRTSGTSPEYEDFLQWLSERSRSEATYRTYKSALNKILKDADLSFEELLQTVERLLPLYEKGGEREAVGDYGRGSGRAVLKKVREYANKG